MMSWGPDDGKSILKYKQKDNCQESHVRDRVDTEEKHKPSRNGNTEMHFYERQLQPPDKQLSLPSRYTQKPQALVPTWSPMTLKPWLSPS